MNAERDPVCNPCCKFQHFSRESSAHSMVDELWPGFAAALITTTVREQYPRLYHKGSPSIQTHPTVR